MSPNDSLPNKKARFGSQVSDRFVFHNAGDVKKALCATQNLDIALSALRSKISLKPSESIPPQDERLSLAKVWMESSPAAQDLFDILETADNMSTQALVTSIFSSLISLFSYHLPDHSYGVAIIKMLLSPKWSRRLNSYINGSNNELILVTLKLFYVISTFGRGRERKLVFETFPWDHKSLPKLLYMRRRGKESERGDIFDRPDIRTYYILFILSMVDRSTTTSVKAAFLEQRQEVFLSMFKGLIQDHYTVIHKVLQTCWEDVWSDPKIKRTTKLGLFNEITISHLLKLYDRAVAEGAGGEHIPADIIHHFLLAICTHPGQGICFRDRGWYPREIDEDDQEEEGVRRKGAYMGKIYNKILANVLRALKVNEDPRQQELALKIVASCPELVAGYWSAASLTLEPRLSSKWIANICFAGQILSQAVPVSSFLLSGSNGLYNPTPPPFPVIMANLLPPVGTKALFTKGLQAASPAIVQHCTALVLAKCLRKLGEIVHVFEIVETALEEDEEGGQWKHRRREVEKEARRRVPEFQVVVAFSQRFLSSSDTAKHALLSESSQRLLWLYQECLPDVVAEARFEVGKLVLNLAEGALTSLPGDRKSGSTERENQGNVASTALQTVKHLHVLRLLSGSDQFGWTGKVASSSHTYFYVLLKTYCNSRVRALRTILKELLEHVLSESVLFQEDLNEVRTWLAALPFHSVRRGPHAEAPDGTPLTDEVNAIATFLDDCAQRCLKTPYRYMEAMSNLAKPSTLDGHQGGLFASPLLMTVLEQILVKVGGKLMTPSDTLAVFTFVRRLLVMLAAKQENSGYHNLLAVLDQLDSTTAEQPYLGHPSIGFGIRRELSIARACLRHFQDDTFPVNEQQSDDTIVAFLDRIEQVSVPPSESVRITIAFELVDWLRFKGVTCSPADISRLASIVRRFYEPALWALISFLHPADGHLWGSNILTPLPDLPWADVTFDWLYFHCALQQLQDRRIRDILFSALCAHPVILARLENAVRLVTHDISVSICRPGFAPALLSLLSGILTGAKDNLSDKELQHLKVVVFRCGTIYGLCTSQDLAIETSEAIRDFVKASFDSNDAGDRALLSSIGSHWVETMMGSLSTGLDLTRARPWVKFVDTEELLAVVDIIQANAGQRNLAVYDLLEEILDTLQYRTPRGSFPNISARKLLALGDVLPRSTLLEDMLSKTLVSQLPVGLQGQITFVEGRPLSSILSGHQPISISDPQPLNLVSRFLEKELWTESTGTIIVVLLYSDPASLPTYGSWLNDRHWTRLHLHTFVPTLVAFLDCTASTGGDLSQVNDDILHSLINQLFLDESYRRSGLLQHINCIHKTLQLSGHRKNRLASVLQERIQGIPIMDFALETTLLARRLVEVSGCDALTTSIVDRALQWAILHLSGENVELENTGMALENLKYVATKQKSLRPHLVEPLLMTLIQHHLSDAGTLDLAVVLTSKTPLKPVVTNRLLQKILQHQRFVAICGRHGNSSQRNQVTRLLEALFQLHPANTCHPSHVEPLFQVYGGTMSSSDRRLLRIIRLFESEKRMSLSAFFSRWSPSPDASVSNTLEVVQNFDPVYMLRTCLAFPLWRRFGEEKGARDNFGDDSMYDPLVVMALSAQMLVDCPPTTPLGWVKVFRSNIVSLLIRCLSSKDPNIRETALCQIARIWESVQEFDMHETPQVLYVLRLLKNAMNPPANAGDPPRRLSTFTTLILLHALRGIFYPSTFIYPRTARFLLQRPELDLSDVPMLFGMLYSKSDDWKKERSWILRMLGDGMASTDDWKVLKRRHTWDLVASLFQSSKFDPAVRAGILEILANLTCNLHACTSLVLKSSLLSWIEMQVRDSPGKESMALLRILENILVVADIPKLHRSAGDRWSSTICRCVSSLLQGKDKDMATLHQCAMVALRLSLIPAIPSHSLLGVLSRAAEYLLCLEPTVHLQQLRRIEQCSLTSTLPLPPHRAHGLLDAPIIAEPLRAWGETVEALWRAGMALEDDGTCPWAMFTRRLVVWRALVGEEGSPVGEWARKQVVVALQSPCVS